MALVVGDLRCHGYGKARAYSYITNDTTATVVGSGYFNNATGFLRKGDFILASTDQDGTEGMTTITVSSETAAATVTTVKTA